ncbi:MAG: helix-turn-helix transcriptional regulator [Bdellovibrionota bacterium]
MDEIIIRSEARPQIKPLLAGIPAKRIHARHSPAALSSLFIETPQSAVALADDWPQDIPRRQKVAIAILDPWSGTRAVPGEAANYVREQCPKATVYAAQDPNAVRRIVRAHSLEAEDRLIASASVAYGRLFVWSCEPHLYACSLSRLPGVGGLPRAEQEQFVISETGSRISWPKADIDLDLDAIRARCDEKFRREREQKIRSEAARYAKAIRALREEKNLKQAGIEGLSEREVRRIETGGQRPRFSSLQKLAAAHRLSLDDYLGELARLSARGERA